MMNEKVYHKKLGEGIILEIKDKYIFVSFFNGTKTVEFQYPKAFEEFLTFHNKELQTKVIKEIQDISDVKEKIKIHPEIKLPKKKKRIHNVAVKGNVAIKCTFCNGGSSSTRIGFSGVCNTENINRNIKEKRSWCNNSACKLYFDGKIDYKSLLKRYRKEGICYEANMLKNWDVYAGIHNSGKHKDEPMKFREVRKNGMVFLTTRFPGSKESDRVIFGAYIIEEYYEGDNKEAGHIVADLDYIIEMKPSEAKLLKFWNYYFNENSPDRMQFSSGLHRYLTNNQSMQILNTICEIKKGTDDEVQAKNILERYVELNGIIRNSVTKPKGPLSKTGESN